MIPAAAVAVIRAAVEDAQQFGHSEPQNIAEQVAEALNAHGWTLAPTGAQFALPAAA
ncbi:hypothetical protein [Streptomyces sp. NPDC021622]|uniref:hypothetical protein n=1 Tax=Streptomyces sp. NPDC021622 TaxID=3155013 RepID=UPI0033C7A0AE